MDESFVEPIDWRAVALAFAIWAAHFSALWGANSVFPDAAASRWIALAATGAALAGLELLRRARRDRGVRTIPALATILSAVAVVFSALPAVVG